MTRLPGARRCRGGIETVLAFSVLALTAAAQNQPSQEQMVFYADADAFLRGGAANTNEGASPLLRLQGAGDNRALVFFDHQKIKDSFGPGAQIIIVSAKLYLTVADDARNWGKNGDRTIDLHRLLTPWAEGNGINNEVPNRFRSRGTGPGVTWNMALDLNINNGRMDPGVPWEMDKKGPNPWDAALSGQSMILNGTEAGTEFEWDVSADVRNWLSGQEPVNAGWIIKKTNARQAGKILFCSREYDAFVTAHPDQATVSTPGLHAPRLVIEYVQRIDPPFNIELKSNADSFLREGGPDSNEGGNFCMRLQASGDNRCLVGFDMGSVLPSFLPRLKKATLSLTISEMADNWGHDMPRTVSAHRLLVPWTEGNGINSENPHSLLFRGSGAGVTWYCPTDTNIANTSADPLGGLKWKGGDGWQSGDPSHFAPATAPGVEHINGMGDDPTTARVSWDVTQDVLAGATCGWLIKKDNEKQSGKVTYYTREGAAAEGLLNSQPQLYLEFGPGN